MGHPSQFEDDDPLLARLRTLCLALPGASERVSHGRPNWLTTKTFAIYGGAVKGEHSNPLLARALIFLPDPQDAGAVEQDPRIHVPAYWGPYGWRALRLNSADVDWVEVAELVESSYRQCSPRRLVAELDTAAE